MSRKSSKREMDDAFNAFLGQSISSEESLDTARVNQFLQRPKKKQPSWMMEDDEDDSEDVGLTGTGKMFLKKKPTETAEIGRKVTEGGEFQISRDSLDDGSFISLDKEERPSGLVPALSLGSTQSNTMNTESMPAAKTYPDFGQETLEELAEKDRFFKNLEKGNKSLDYNRMNQALDEEPTLGPTMVPKPAGRNGHLKELDVSDESKAHTLNDEQQAKLQDGDMLSKVALLDSLDSTTGTKAAASRETLKDDDLEVIPEGISHRDEGSVEDELDGHTKEYTEDHRVDTTGRLKTVTAYTDTSRELEAYHQALRQVGQGGLDTMETANNLSLKDSDTAMGGTYQTVGTLGDDSMDIRPVPSKRTGKIGDPQNQSDLVVKPSVHFKDGREVQEFTLESTEQSTTDPGRDVPADPQGYDISPLDEFPDGKSPFFSDKWESNGDLHSHLSNIPPAYPDQFVPSDSSVGKKKSGKFSHISSSGYGKKNSGKSPVRREWSPADVSKAKIKGTENAPKHSKQQQQVKTRSSLADSQLLASVRSFTSYIQDHFSGNEPLPDVSFTHLSDKIPVDGTFSGREAALVKEAEEWQQQWKEERRRVAKLTADINRIEQENQRVMDKQHKLHDQEVFTLKQENFVLAAQVAERKERAARAAVNSGDTPEQQSRVEMLEKEVQEQEKLIAGYEQQNQQLYNEMKKIQTTAKDTEQKMFRENQRLKSQLASLREESSQRDVAGSFTGLTTGGSAVLGAGRIAQLEAELKQSKSREGSLVAQLEIEKRTKLELEQQIDQMVSHTERLKAQLDQLDGPQARDNKTLNKKQLEEIERLQRKIRWYAENQELLDKDSAIMAKKDDEIKRLKIRLEQIETDAGRRQTEAKSRVKERAADAKRIQDLQRQVREMEGIIRKRHPNSLPVLMWAAASAPDVEMPKLPSVKHLEERVVGLEKEIEEKDEEAKRSLRLLEQKYNSMKVQYEDHISELEKQLTCYRRDGDKALTEGAHPHTHAVALERELTSVKQRYKQQTAQLEQDLQETRSQLSKLGTKQQAAERSETRLAEELSSELQLRIRALEKEVTIQAQEKQQLQTNIQKLQLEKQQKQITRPVSATSQLKKKGKLGVGATGGKKTEEKPVPGPSILRPLTNKDEKLNEKEYAPATFTQENITDLVFQNQQLKAQLEQVQLGSDQQRVNLQKSIAEAEARERRVQEQAEHRLEVVKAAHETELKQIIGEHAMKVAMSREAELFNKVESQQVVIDQLKSQLLELDTARSELDALKIRESTLEKEVHELLLELKDARETHTPELRHLQSLQDKIRQLEARHEKRNRDLQQLTSRPPAPPQPDMTDQLHQCQTRLHAKNLQAEQFRTELDSILEVLRELQRQGVMIPLRSRATTPS